MLWPTLISLLALVAVVLLHPLWRHAERPLPAGLDDEEGGQALAGEKRHLLAELRRLRDAHAEGRMDEADYAALESECQQALAAVMERQAAPHPSPERRVVAPGGMARGLGSLAMLFVLAGPSLFLFDPPASPAGSGADSLEGALRQLEKRLAADPGHVGNRVLAARSYEAMGRQAEALDAWAKVLARDPGHREARFNLALSLIQSEDAGARGKGLAYLDTLLEAEPQDPVLLWYRGVALFSLERKQDAHATWLKLQAILPPHGENAELVREALDRSRQ